MSLSLFDPLVAEWFARDSGERRNRSFKAGPRSRPAAMS